MIIYNTVFEYVNLMVRGRRMILLINPNLGGVFRSLFGGGGLGGGGG